MSISNYPSAAVTNLNSNCLSLSLTLTIVCQMKKISAPGRRGTVKKEAFKGDAPDLVDGIDQAAFERSQGIDCDDCYCGLYYTARVL